MDKVRDKQGNRRRLHTAVFMAFLLLPVLLLTSPGAAQTSYWEYVGPAGFSAGAAQHPGVVVNEAGEIFTAFIDQGAAGTPTARAFDGSGWAALPGLSADPGGHTGIALDSQGLPWVAFADGAQNGRASVKRFDGTSWHYVGSAGFSAGSAEYLDLTFDGSGTPYLVYLDGDQLGAVTVERFEGLEWEVMGMAGFSAGSARWPRIALAGTMPFVVYGDDFYGGRASVQTLYDGAWHYLGGAGFTAGPVDYTDIAVDSNGTPYIVFQDITQDSTAQVMRWNGATWTAVAVPGFTLDRGSDMQIAVDAADRPIIAYQNWSYSYKASVLRFEGTNWYAVGAESATPGTASDIHLFVNGVTPYLAFSDGNQGGRVSVMRFVDAFVPAWLTISKQADSDDGTQFPFALELADTATIWGSGFYRPDNITVSADGFVYVSEYPTSRIKKFTARGELLRSWNGSPVVGNFNHVSGVATDSQHNVYVADVDNHRIHKFDSDGNLLLVWGSLGSGNGQFNRPAGLGVDAQDNVYVADMMNHRIQKFDANAGYLGRWGGYGGGAGQFDNPGGLDFDRDGNAYVVDNYNHRVQKFDSTGRFLRAWGWDVVQDGGIGYEVCTPDDTCKKGVLGPAAGQLYHPSNLSVDEDGRVLVADRTNHRIQVYSGNGEFLEAWGWDVIDDGGGAGFEVCSDAALCRAGAPGGALGQFYYPSDVGLDGEGAIFVTDQYNHRVQRFFATEFTLAHDERVTFTLEPGTYHAGELVPDGWTLSQINCAADEVQIDGAGVELRLARGDQASCTFRNMGPPQLTLAKETLPPGGAGFDFTLVSLLDSWGGLGSQPGEFDNLYGLDVDAAGNIYVADTGNGRVQFLDKDGNYLHEWSTNLPTDTAVDKDGNVYVAMPYNDQVQKIDSSGNPLGPPLVNGFRQPWGVAVDKFGDLYVADSQNHRVHKYDVSAATWTVWGGYGSGPGQFKTPLGLAVDQDLNVYVADTGNDRIQKFDGSGALVLQFNERLQGPYDVDIDSAGNVYVADTGNERIVKFDDQGGFLHAWTEQVSGPGGVALDAGDRLFVANRGTREVRKFLAGRTRLDDGQQQTFTLRPGSYDIREFLPQEWFNAGVECRGLTPDRWQAGVNRVTVELDYSDDVTCTFTNESLAEHELTAELALSKTTQPAGYEDFLFSFFGELGYWTGFGHPRGVDLDDAGNVYVAEASAGLVKVYDPSMNFLLAQWTVHIPNDVAVDRDGHVHVSNYSGYVQEFDRHGRYISRLNGRFNQPYGVAAAADGSIYVADTYYNRVQKFDSSGQPVVMWGWGVSDGSAVFQKCVEDPQPAVVCKVGLSGDSEGQFRTPIGLTVDDAAGFVYVADSGNNRIQKFTTDGDYVMQWAGGSAPFAGPYSVDVNAQGDLYVVEYHGNRVQKFDSEGLFLMAWGSGGGGVGQFSSPHRVAVDKDGNIYVAEYHGGRVQKFYDGAQRLGDGDVFYDDLLPRSIRDQRGCAPRLAAANDRLPRFRIGRRRRHYH